MYIIEEFMKKLLAYRNKSGKTTTVEKRTVSGQRVVVLVRMITVAA